MARSSATVIDGTAGSKVDGPGNEAAGCICDVAPSVLILPFFCRGGGGIGGSEYGGTAPNGLLCCCWVFALVFLRRRDWREMVRCRRRTNLIPPTLTPRTGWYQSHFHRSLDPSSLLACHYRDSIPHQCRRVEKERKDRGLKR